MQSPWALAVVGGYRLDQKPVHTDGLLAHRQLMDIVVCGREGIWFDAGQLLYVLRRMATNRLLQVKRM